MKRQARAIVVSASLASIGGAWLASTQGCSLITSYDGFAPIGATCTTPIPPKPAGGGPGDVGQLVGAMKSIRFVDKPGLNQLGYDLDGLCTTDVKPACKSPGGKIAADVPPNTGIDNAIGLYVSALPFLNDAPAQMAIQRGLVGLVVVVTNWNGLDDDPTVGVSLYNVVGVNDSTDGGGTGAKFDGNDTFVVGDGYVEIGGLPDMPLSKFVDPVAYVTGGTLVARFGTALPFRFRFIAPNLAGGSTALEIVLSEAAFIGKIKKPTKGKGLEMDDVQLTGRMEALELLHALAGVGYYCPDGGGAGADASAAAKGLACGLLDLADTHARDGKNVPCAAASFAIGASITGAKIGTVGPTSIGPFVCEDPTATCP